ncbi:hypothetical protein ACCT25_36245, partial [Rhizobium ruizarguesonis]
FKAPPTPAMAPEIAYILIKAAFGEALVMLVLGGTGSLFGALSGTVIFMLFEDYVSAANPFHWLTMVGALLIAVVLFAPKGLYGTAATFIGRRREQRS